MTRSIAATQQPAPTADARASIRGYDWTAVAAELDRDGYARLPKLLNADAARHLRALYDERRRFRSFVDMDQHRYGSGDYRYFAAPLPSLVRTLRTHLYRRLSPIANRWQRRLGFEYRYPAHLSKYLAECHDAGQQRPTPLLLRYAVDGFNCLHRDRYGDLAFPFQVVCLLSKPEAGDGCGEFGGGEFLLSEQRPRQQTRVEAISLEHGEGLIFPNHVRPIEGARGTYRAQMRHGVSRIHSGTRLALGIIFHDAL